MPNQPWEGLGAREREIMHVLFRLGEASVGQVRDELTSPPGYSGVRAMLGALEEKGHIRHRRVGLRYLYSSAHNVSNAGTRALRHLVDTFYGGSPERTVAALLKLPDQAVESLDLEELKRAIVKARREGR